MMTLDATTKSVEVVLEAAVATTQFPIIADYIDLTTTSPFQSMGCSDTQTNDTTAVTAVAAPSSGVQRLIEQISVCNCDTQAGVVVVSLNNNGTLRQMVRVELLPGWSLRLTANSAPQILDASGNEMFDDGDGRAGSLLAAAHVGGAGGVACNPISGVVNGTSLTTLTLANDNLYATFFVAPPRAASINRIGVYVTTGVASCEVRLGLYEVSSEGNLYPTNLLFGSGALSIATSSTAATASLSQALVPGRIYALALNAKVPSGSPIIRGVAVGGMYPVFGISDALSDTTPFVALKGTRTYGALPSTFPASVAAVAATCPAIAMRYSS